MNDKCPVVVIHRGNQRYFRDVIGFAEKNGNEVYVIGDDSNRNCDNWIDYRDLNTDLCDRFCAVYKHMSTNPYNYELICFQRYYWMYEFMVRKGLNQCFHLDSDILLFMKLNSSIFEDVCDAACSYVPPKMGLQGVASIHFSYWTRDALYDFLQFLIDAYENRLDIIESQYEKEKGNPGGICDMRLLSYWIAETGRNVISLENFYKETVLDQNIDNDRCLGEELEMTPSFGIRKIRLDKGKAFFRTLSGKEYNAGAIHFQGAKKMFIHCFSKGRNGSADLIIANIEYWINRVYEKIQRSFGNEKRYAWK